MPPQEVPVRERRTHLCTATPHHFPQLMGAIAASNKCVSRCIIIAASQKPAC